MVWCGPLTLRGGQDLGGLEGGGGLEARGGMEGDAARGPAAAPRTAVDLVMDLSNLLNGGETTVEPGAASSMGPRSHGLPIGW